MSTGAPRLLQFEVDWSQFFKGRLNQIVPLEDAHDCGANTLLLLGRINEEFALELSMDQSMCGGHYTRANYLFPTFLFTEIEKKYEYKLFDHHEHLLDFLKCKCKILFYINSNALTRYIYKDYIKKDYTHIYQASHINIDNVTRKKKHTNVLIISNL